MALTNLMLDTSAYAAFMYGHPDVIVEVRRAAAILFPIVVLGELWAGFEAGTRRDKNRQELEAFLKSPRVSIVHLIEQTAERYAQIYIYLRENGRPIPTNDLWIAASSMEHGAVLLTADSHFLVVPHITVKHVSTSSF